MRTLIIIVSMFMLTSCKGYDFNISELKQEKLRFEELPIAVKEFLMHPPEYDPENSRVLILIDSLELQKYKLEVVKTKVGPWTDYFKLLDISNKVTYRINQGSYYPFFVYKNKLYIPNRFNILTTIDDKSKVEFTCYLLK